jgi:formylglycine-generating enzyme required for sulfatase activity
MSQADLEISLFHRTAESYGLALRFRHAAAGLDKPASGSWTLDAAELLKRQYDPVVYGEQLAAQLFGSPDVRSFLEQALAVAASRQTPLHLRLFIHADAKDLHSLHWETLRLPGSDAPLVTGERVRFSRYLDGIDWHPVRTAERDALQALIAVASPDVTGTTLAEVRTGNELAAARTGLGDIPAAELAGRGQVTLNNLLARLRDGCDILYMVAHGMLVDGEPQILLEREDGGRAWASGRELAARLGELAQPPSLVVLVSCQSAGKGEGEPSTRDGGALAGLGPQLAAAGVPAVVAMQGNVTMVTAAAFMCVFLRELRRDGQVDRAMAVARGAVLQRMDWWMPVLFTRLEDGRVFDLPNAADDPLFDLPALPQRDLPDDPFHYLDWYREKDAEIFFGRGREIRDLYDRVTSPDGDPIILLYGQSGVGKSSLLAAGLLPRLKASHEIRYVRRDQSKGLLGTLAVELEIAQGDDVAAKWRNLEAQAGKPLLVVLDQAEEFFTRPNREQPDELAEFLGTLVQLFGDASRRPSGRLILGFRKEWLAELDKRLAERALPRKGVFLERLGRAGIAEVVAGPTSRRRLRRHYGLAVADALPDQIADDLLADRESPVAPMLAILLADMWDEATKRRRDQPTFDDDLYHELRTRGLSLDDFLERQLGSLRSEMPEVVSSGLALDLLAHHTTALGAAEQRTMADLEQTYSHRLDVLSGLVQQCQDLYLLVDPAKNRPGQPPASRLTHDTLAPYVRRRFDESDASGQRARRILESRGVDWGDGREGAPLDEADLAWVEAGTDGMRAQNSDEERLVQASAVARDKRKEQEARVAQELEDARRREKEDAKKIRRNNKRLTTLLVVVGVLFVVAASSVWVANNRITIGQNLLRIQGDFLTSIETRGLDRQALGLQRSRLSDAESELPRLWPARHQLPNLSGAPLDGAQKRLADLCQPAPCLDTRLRWEISEQVAWGHIVRSDPVAGARLYWGAPVTLTVSIGPPETIDDLINMDLIRVPAGEFTMGSDPALGGMTKQDERPQFVGYLPEFSIGRTEITNAQYAVFAHAPGNTVRSPWEGGSVPQGMEQHPVVDVSWYDAVRYTQWLSDLTGKPYRLCTEAEWEKACRGAAGQLYPWGNDFNGDYLNYAGSSTGSTTPVGEFSPQGDSPYGAADMAGNVFEWTSSLWRPYPYDKDDGREQMFGPGARVQRGGSFGWPADGARCAARFDNFPDSHFNNHGFRVCLSPEP